MTLAEIDFRSHPLKKERGTQLFGVPLRNNILNGFSKPTRPLVGQSQPFAQAAAKDRIALDKHSRFILLSRSPRRSRRKVL